jgi:hypothetical protein
LRVDGIDPAVVPTVLSMARDAVPAIVFYVLCPIGRV